MFCNFAFHSVFNNNKKLTDISQLNQCKIIKIFIAKPNGVKLKEKYEMFKQLRFIFRKSIKTKERQNINK